MNGGTSRIAVRPRDPLRGARFGMRFGVLVGCSTWIIVLGVICAATGRTEYLLPVVVPLLLASFGLGLLVLAGAEPLLALPAEHRARYFLPILMGSIGVVGGVLCLLAEGFVVPVLQDDHGLGEIVRSTGGVLDLPRWVAVALLAMGVSALTFGLRRVPLPEVSASRDASEA
jgi:hypothetical protein